jgi:hypothetical protein
MDDPNYLRKVNLDEIDFSKYGKDYSAEELAAVKQALQQEQQRHVESFDKLPLLERAKYHVGDMADFVQQNPETLLGAATGAVLAGAGAKAVEKTASTVDKTKQVFGSLRDMMANKQEDGLLANQQAEKAAKQAEMTAKEVSATQTPTTETPLETKVKPLQPVEKTIVEQGTANTELKKAETQVKAVEKELAAGAAKGLPPPGLTTGSGMPAHQGLAPEGTRLSKNIPSLEKVPKDMVFVPQGQYMDIVRNAVGQEPYTANLKATGGYPVSPEAAYKQSREINQSLGRLARSEAIEKGASLGDVTKSITKKIGGSKAVKVAGVGGTLIALSDLALAGEKAKEGQYAEAAKIGVPAAAGLVNPAAGGLTEAAVNPSASAQQLRNVAPILGTFAEIANQKAQQFLKKPKGSIQPPR